MSTRRARIKAVASLPVRKKAVISEKPDKSTKDVGEPECEQSINISEMEKSTTNRLQSPTSNDQKVSLENTNQETSAQIKEMPQRRRIMKPAINISSTRKTKVLEKSDSHLLKSPQPLAQQSTTGKDNSKDSLTKKKYSPEDNLIKKSPKKINTEAICGRTAKNLAANIDSILSPESFPGLKQKSIKKITNLQKVDLPEAVCNNNGINPLPVEGIRPLVSSLSEYSLAATPTEECSFDPIIPLPSASKNRPKLKPIPCLALRRNSLQGSTSESEDEVKRIKREDLISSVARPLAAPPPPAPSVLPSRVRHDSLTSAGRMRHDPLTSTSRVRNDSVSSGFSRVRNDSVCSATADSLNLAPSTPRQKPRSWRAGGAAAEADRRAAARRKALQKPQHNALTMYDLIFYNPPNNSIRNPNDAPPDTVQPPNDPVQEEKQEAISAPEKEQEEDDPDEAKAMPVPQVKLGPNGEIVIDEQSLVIETTEAVRSRKKLSHWAVVYDSGNASGGSYGHARRSREWGHAETLRFYKALNTLGTDFSLMLALFPGRSRRDLKVKFKKEERYNGSYVDRALMNPLDFNIQELEEELAKEQQEAATKEKEKQQMKLKRKQQPSLNYRNSSAAARSMIPEETIENKNSLSSKKTAKKPRMKASALMSDSLVNDSGGWKPISDSESSADETAAVSEPSAQLLSPAGLLPPNVEVGSMVVLASEMPGQPDRNILQAYIVQLVDGKTKMSPIDLPADMLLSISKTMGVVQVKPQNHPEQIPEQRKPQAKPSTGSHANESEKQGFSASSVTADNYGSSKQSTTHEPSYVITQL